MHGETILFLEPAEVAGDEAEAEAAVDLDHIRPDLAELIARHAITLDANRPASVSRRRKTNQRTARENIAQLVDEGSFVEYGSLAIAAQRRRRKVDDLIKNTPADGLIAGVATVNAEKFGAHDARCMVISYDYTVLAGTQGHMNHKKIDRMLGLAEQWRMPLVFYGEGGGGRPGDTDRLGMTGLDGPSFVQFAKLSGLVPVVGVVSGYCFAGNAAMLGCCDVIIATQNASIGMGGPAMIEGGGLGVYHPADVGPVSFQAPNGVIDILVEDEEAATSAAQKYLSYFQGAVADWKARGSAPAAACHPGKPAARLRHPHRHRSAGRRRLGARNTPGFRRRHDHRLHSHRRQAVRIDRQQPKASRRGDRRAGRATRPRASCSCAMPSTFRSCRCAIRRASWWGPRPRRPRSCAMSRACS